MENFIAYNPTKLHFGKGILDDLHKTLVKYGKRVLLVYGKGSIKKNGLYEKIMSQLNTAGAEVFEYEGIKSNPLVEDVDKAARIGRENNVDFVLAVGGGSVIDSAKIISITIPVSHGAWDFFEGKSRPQKALPLIAVLTLAATGSEMNNFAVLQNPETKQKEGYGSPFTFPTHSFLDPEVTYSVPATYTAYGIADLIAHCLEMYYGKGECSLTDRFITSIVADAVAWGPKLMNNLTGYEERANIMFDATMALNLITSYGKAGGDWGVHDLGHIVSLLHDTPHGASLSILFPAWLKHFNAVVGEKTALLGKNVFNVSSSEETIKKLEAFFTTIGAPTRFSQIGIGEDKLEGIIQQMIQNKATGNNITMAEKDYRKIIELAK